MGGLLSGEAGCITGALLLDDVSLVMGCAGFVGENASFRSSDMALSQLSGESGDISGCRRLDGDGWADWGGTVCTRGGEGGVGGWLCVDTASGDGCAGGGGGDGLLDGHLQLHGQH